MVSTSPSGSFPLVEEDVPHYGTTQRYKCWQKGPGYPNSEVSLTLTELYESTTDKLDQTFVVYDEERFTFGEMLSQTGAIAREMRGGYGIQKGEVVAIAGRNSPEWICAFMAASGFCGAVALPMNSMWKSEELEYGLEDSDSTLIFLDGERLQVYGDALARWIPKFGLRLIGMRCEPPGGVSFASAAASGSKRSALPRLVVNQDDCAVLMYTSGTTSNPKGVLSTHRQVMSAINTNNSIYAAGMAKLMAAVKPGSPLPAIAQAGILVGVPLFHATGLHAILLSSFYPGRKVVLMRKWDATKALELIQQEKITQLTGVPTMSYEIMNHPDFDKYDTSSLVSIGGGGAAFKASFAKEIQSKFKKGRANQGWGMTETNSLGTGTGGKDYLQHPDSCGRPAKMMEVCAIDTNTLEPLVPNSVGELCIRGAAVMSQYYKKPAKTAEALHIDRDGKLWMRTGDIGRVNEEGFVFIMDRIKDLIIRGGENISCAEVESKVYEHPSVAEVAVFGMPDDRLGETVAAAVALKPGAKPATVQEILDVCSTLARFKVPSNVFFWPEAGLPKGATGKIHKKTIKEALLKTPSGSKL